MLGRLLFTETTNILGLLDDALLVGGQGMIIEGIVVSLGWVGGAEEDVSEEEGRSRKG